jgi:SAM-dependent methyltransferase
MPESIDRSEGRRLFGLDPESYHGVRPDYPDWIFTALVEAQVLYPGAATLEIGAGSGLATRHLLRAGVDPLVLVEPDERFAGVLNGLIGSADADCRLVSASFEDAVLDAASFDLVVAATSFHWLDPASGLVRIRALLKRDGGVALMWNVFHQPGREDPFHEATHALLHGLATSPSGSTEGLPFPLDRAARETDARSAGFRHVTYRESRWTIELDGERTVRLYESFSNIARLPPERRAEVLGELRRIADTDFGGRVERPVTSCLYVLR